MTIITKNRMHKKTEHMRLYLFCALLCMTIVLSIIQFQSSGDYLRVDHSLLYLYGGVGDEKKEVQARRHENVTGEQVTVLAADIIKQIPAVYGNGKKSVATTATIANSIRSRTITSEAENNDVAKITSGLENAKGRNAQPITVLNNTDLRPSISLQDLAITNASVAIIDTQRFISSNRTTASDELKQSSNSNKVGNQIDAKQAIDSSDEDYFITNKILSLNDCFAASWWQSRDRFLKLNVSRIQTVEDDAFAAISADKGRSGRDDVLMTRDWLDFAVEHMSKWWKMEFSQPSTIYMTNKMKAYVNRHLQWEGAVDGSNTSKFTHKIDDMMNTTLALIPLGISDMSHQADRDVWTSTLAATITALLQHGIARIVVTGYYHADAERCIEALELLMGRGSRERFLTTEQLSKPLRDAAKFPNMTHIDYFETAYAGTEIAFVHTENVETIHVSINVPRGALNDLYNAMTYYDDNIGESKFDNINVDHATAVERYFGKLSTRTAAQDRFEFIYLTEADQILQARMSAKMLKEMDNGYIVIPHRLQPLPHPTDTRNFESRNVDAPYSPNSAVVELNISRDSCLDTTDRAPKVCLQFWYMCGHVSRNFTFLQNVTFVMLSGGSGIVGVSANEHGRICKPIKN